jgi:hypothetical protein
MSGKMISLKQQKYFWKYAILEKKPTTIILLLTNLAALIGILIFSTNYAELFISYVFQSIIIAIFYFKKIKSRNKYSTRGIYFHNYSFENRNEQIERYKSSNLKMFAFVEICILALFLFFVTFTAIINTVLLGLTFGIFPLIIIYYLNHYYSYKINKGKEFVVYQDIHSCVSLGIKRNFLITLLALIGLGIITYINTPILLAIVIIAKIYFDILMHEIEHYNHKLVESQV